MLVDGVVLNGNDPTSRDPQCGGIWAEAPGYV